jgi:hypothetical protein
LALAVLLEQVQQGELAELPYLQDLLLAVAVAVAVEL